MLALVSLDTALPCARQLRETFCGLMCNGKESPTLSVGIAVGHFMESLEDLLGWARDAEKDAKDHGRDALAVHLRPRGGAPLKVCGKWSPPAGQPLDHEIVALAQMHLAEQIPDKAGYDLRQMASEYSGWPHDTAQRRDHLTVAIRADAARLVARKRARRLLPGEASPLLQMVEALDSAAGLEDVAARVILSRHIADALSQAQGSPVAAEKTP